MLDELKQLISEDLRVPADRLDPDATWDDLGMDSLALAELAVVLEHRYPGIDGDQLLAARTMRGLAQSLESAGIR